MDNQDKLFDKIKEASQNAEFKDFPGMENVWNRVEQKLDTKVLKKETKLWKKLAVAASILLVVSVGYHFWSNEKATVTPANEIVITDSITTPIIEENNAVADVEKHPAIKENAEQILKEQTKTANVVVMNDTVKRKKIIVPMPAVISEVIVAKDDAKKEKEANSYDGYLNNEVYKTRSAEHSNLQTTIQTKKKTTSPKGKVTIKEEPLLVIDNVAEDLQKLGKLNADDVESIVVLAEPLYIINGVEYSEVEVFGPNPTSPYSPLNQQEIETISILQKEKATEIYGKKGEKGVVIITTKNGKPKLKK